MRPFPNTALYSRPISPRSMPHCFKGCSASSKTAEPGCSGRSRLSAPRMQPRTATPLTEPRSNNGWACMCATGCRPSGSSRLAADGGSFECRWWCDAYQPAALSRSLGPLFRRRAGWLAGGGRVPHRQRQSDPARHAAGGRLAEAAAAEDRRPGRRSKPARAWSPSNGSIGRASPPDGLR